MELQLLQKLCFGISETGKLKKKFLLIILLCSLNIHSQEKEEAHLPVVFGELILGGAGKIQGNGGLLYGAELNYQHEKDLFSIRYTEHSQLVADAHIIIFPVWRAKHVNKEIGFLYGRRWVNGGMSFSISGGVSVTTYLSNLRDNNDEIQTFSERYPGFPFEVNVKLFKSKKTRYRIFYGLIPVGKPTAFGRNFGLKLVGNISKNSFIGLGFVFGLGIHKQY